MRWGRPERLSERLCYLVGHEGPPPEQWLISTPVSPRVNSVKHDDAALLQPAGKAAPYDSQPTPSSSPSNR